jgi:hypothetical protein
MTLERKPTLTTRTNLEAVERYILKQDIILTDEQQELLLRIQFADEKKRARVNSREEIINAIVTRFGVSMWRADQDITDSQKLFGATRKINKNYLLAQLLDNIEKQIHVFEKARQYALIPKLNDNYTYALNSLPPDQLESQTSPTTIIFIVKAPDNARKKTVDELLQEAEAITKETPEPDDYIEYEESV